MISSDVESRVESKEKNEEWNEWWNKWWNESSITLHFFWKDRSNEDLLEVRIKNLFDKKCIFLEEGVSKEEGNDDENLSEEGTK